MVNRQQEITRIQEALFRYRPGHWFDFDFIGLIRKDAITLRRLFEYECNGCTREKFTWETFGHYDRARAIQMKWVEERQKQVLARLDRRLKEAGIPYYIQSDPRGCSLYLCTTSQGNYHQEGIPVY